MQNNSTLLGAIAAVVLGLTLIFAVPLVLLGALNTLFGLEIPYSFKTWLAAAFIIVIFGRSIKKCD